MFLAISMHCRLIYITACVQNVRQQHAYILKSCACYW